MSTITKTSFHFDRKKSRSGDILQCVECICKSFTVNEFYKVLDSKLMNDRDQEVPCSSAKFAFVGNTVDGSVQPDIAKLMKGLRSSLHIGNSPVTTSAVPAALATPTTSNAQFLECIVDEVNVGDWLICEEVYRDEKNDYSKAGLYCVQEDAFGMRFISGIGGRSRYSSYSKFLFHKAGTKADTHNIEVNCQIEQDDTPKQWEPDTIKPSIDIMKSIRDACRG